MEQNKGRHIVVQVQVNAPIETVWECWTTPQDIVKWNHASSDWHSPLAENDLREGGRFNYRMEAKDGSMGFDFEGIYDKILANKEINYTIGDGRKVSIAFSSVSNQTKIVGIFEAENIYPIEKQREGWQAILNNFKKHVEAKQP